MDSLDARCELNYADRDPQFAPDPDEYSEERESKYIDALNDLRVMIENCQSTVSHIKDEYRTRKISGIEIVLDNMIEDIDKLIEKGL